jgi:hypothetical protein
VDSNIIAVVGTLGGVIISAIGTYFIQKTVSERQRKWSLEDQDRNRQDELEREQRRIKRELLSKRLEVVEETVRLMMRVVRAVFAEEMELPVYDDKHELAYINKHIESIRGDAWASIHTVGSEDLSGYWRQISNAYWAAMETSHIEAEQWNQSQDAYFKMYRLMDEMKSKV